MRQVLVKSAPAATSLLSGIVTSATNVAWLVQSGGLVGTGVAGGEVLVGSMVEVASVAVAVRVAVVVADADIVGTAVSVRFGEAVSTGVCPPPQAESMIAISEITMNSFLDILNLRCSPTRISCIDLSRVSLFSSQNIIICKLDFSSGSLATCSSNVSRVNTGTSTSVRNKRYFTT